MSTVDLPHKWQYKWQNMLQAMFEADNLGLVRWQPVLDVAEEEGYYKLYTSAERFSNKPNADVLRAFKQMMTDFYTRKICLKLRQPHCDGHPLPRGSCTKSRRHSIVSNAAAKADGRKALSNARSNPVTQQATMMKRVAATAAELQAYRCDPARDGRVFVPIDTIQEVLTRRHRFDSSAYGSRPRIKKLTFEQAFDSKQFAMYFGITKQRIGSFEDWLRLTNKSLHDEPFR
jgi:hypothetical protein